jgi:hypothetical protein
MKEVFGLDTASSRFHTIRILPDLTPADPYSFRSSESNPDVRRIELFFRAKEFFSVLALRHPGAHVFCEEPISGRNGKTNRLLALACGAIWAAHVECDLMWHWVDITAWKKSVVGRGDVRKDQIREWSIENGAPEDWEEDHYDAHGIGVHGAQILAEVDGMAGV